MAGSIYLNTLSASFNRQMMSANRRLERELANATLGSEDGGHPRKRIVANDEVMNKSVHGVGGDQKTQGPCTDPMQGK